MSQSISIPFRCPSCEDGKSFSSLNNLRDHLAKEHAHLRSRPRFRDDLLSREKDMPSRTIGRHSPLLESFHNDTRKLEEDLRKNKEEELNNKKHRSRILTDDTLPVRDGGNDFPGYRKKKVHRNVRHGMAGRKESSFREYGHSSRVKNKYLGPERSFRKVVNYSGGENTLTLEEGEEESNARSNEGITKVDEEVLEHLYRPKNLTISGMKARPYIFQNNTSELFPEVSGENHFKETLSTLSQEVMVERASQKATADSLYMAHEVLAGVEKSAEQRVMKQQEIITSLALELKEKEQRLAQVTIDMEQLKNRQERSVEKVNDLQVKSNQETQHLQDELLKKQTELDKISKKIEEIKRCTKNYTEPSLMAGGEQSLQETKTKVEATKFFNEQETTSQILHKPHNFDGKNIYQAEKESEAYTVAPVHSEISFTPFNKQSQESSFDKDLEVKQVKAKSQQLELDRQNLLQQMQSLLEIATSDNEKLKSEITDQGRRLCVLSSELNKSKKEQSELLGETNALYEQADSSLSKLKAMLLEREQQLSSLSSSLDQAHATQEQLARERDDCLRLAKEREAVYKTVMNANNSQVETLKETLQSTEGEKEKLIHCLNKLKETLEKKEAEDKIKQENEEQMKSALKEQDRAQNKLREDIKKKEGKLQQTRKELDRMKVFLSSTAEKELDARAKLEAFISDLINRASTAENELKRMKKEYASKSVRLKDVSKKHRKKPGIPDSSHLPRASLASSQQHKPKSDVFTTWSDGNSTDYFEPALVPSQSPQGLQYPPAPQRHR